MVAPSWRRDSAAAAANSLNLFASNRRRPQKPAGAAERLREHYGSRAPPGASSVRLGAQGEMMESDSLAQPRRPFNSFDLAAAATPTARNGHVRREPPRRVQLGRSSNSSRAWLVCLRASRLAWTVILMNDGPHAFRRAGYAGAKQSGSPRDCADASWPAAPVQVGCRQVASQARQALGRDASRRWRPGAAGTGGGADRSDRLFGLRGLFPLIAQPIRQGCPNGPWGRPGKRAERR